MTFARTRTFRSGNSEAVRLPKSVAFGENVELLLIRSGDVITMYPVATGIPEMIAQLAALPAPLAIETRDDEPFSDRDGL